jgi:hypothetical protein
MRTFIRVFNIIIAVLIVSGCKKYPENNLWFKKPAKQGLLFGYLQKYEVNGIDSLDLLSNYIITGHINQINDIRKCEFHQYYESGRIGCIWRLAGSCDLHMYQDYVAKYKKVKFSQTIDPTCFNKSLFIGPNIEWTILNFPTKKRPFLKIKTTLDNGNTYEIKTSY